MDAFYEQYQLGDVLGEGGFGQVFRCQEKASGTMFAVKTVEPSKIQSTSDKDKVKNEISICSVLDHMHVVRLYASFNEMGRFMMVFELLEGGELFDILCSRDTYSELDANHCIKQLLLALAYLHGSKIIHRDIKPENLMLVKPPINGSLHDTVLKLVDFGIAKQLTNKQSRISCDTSGTPYYLAPETLKQELIGSPVDMWAAGVILYVLLVGSLPFWLGEKGKGEMFWKIVKGDYSMDKVEWDAISGDAKRLVSDMLTLSQDDRISAETALQSEWIRNKRRVSTIERRQTLCRLKAFNAKRKLRSAIFAVIAHRRIKSQTPPRAQRKTSGISNSGDELGSESESSVVDEGEVAAANGQVEYTKQVDLQAKLSPLSIPSVSACERNASESGDSGVAESPVMSQTTDGLYSEDTVMRQRLQHASLEEKARWKKKRNSIKNVVKELNL